ncbi:MAG: peptidoglycan-binding protein [Clostridia bacterium]|nr:peptidoglycan-binding protein [Clostridia bacterium]
MPSLPKIPEYITVHLGDPDASAPNVTLPFEEYIANVASSEIYPTWNENAIRANIYAQISFALNRIYTEFYRSRGYDFDITNSTAYDQSFVRGRTIFDNISNITAEIFNSYVRRRGSYEPLFTAYCDGIEITCAGLSQWGSLSLAEQGYTPYDILRYYYGNDIDIITDAEVGGANGSAPAVPLSIGSQGDKVRLLQIRLNRISDNYPAIPKIAALDGIFSSDTDAAVKSFQQIFGLTADGIVGNATWYSVQRIYNAVKRLNELDSEGIRLEEVTKQYPGVLSFGSTGLGVQNLQYFLSYISRFYSTISPVAIDGSFGNETRASVISAQSTFGLPQDGIVGELTWDAIYDAYRGIVDTIPLQYVEGNVLPFPGTALRIGSEGDAVLLLQQYINVIASVFPEVNSVELTSYFGTQTDSAVRAIQELSGLEVNGVVGAITWNAITSLYTDIINGSRLTHGQFPGFDIGGT